MKTLELLQEQLKKQVLIRYQKPIEAKKEEGIAHFTELGYGLDEIRITLDFKGYFKYFNSFNVAVKVDEGVEKIYNLSTFDFTPSVDYPKGLNKAIIEFLEYFEAKRKAESLLKRFFEEKEKAFYDNLQKYFGIEDYKLFSEIFDEKKEDEEPWVKEAPGKEAKKIADNFLSTLKGKNCRVVLHGVDYIITPLENINDKWDDCDYLVDGLLYFERFCVGRLKELETQKSFPG